VRCFEEDVEACAAQPQVPVSHRLVALAGKLLGRAFD
jgi:hypothetical protein